jgi:nitrate/nitrite-specific signal transduction histidine kinase
MGGDVSVAGDRTPGAVRGSDGGSEDLLPEVRRLREQVDAAGAAINTLRDRCDELEESKAHLTRLAVASAQLHESDDEAETLRNLLDLMVNLVGTEQIAVWRLTADGTLELRTSQGIDAEPWQRIPVDQSPLGKAVSSGEIVVEAEPRTGGPRVCVPLLVGRRAVGVAAVFRLLPHRGGLGPQDADVFRMISQQAGFALCCSDKSWGAGRKVGNG